MVINGALKVINGDLMVIGGDLPSGKHTKKLWKMAIEIVDLPIKKMVIFQPVIWIIYGLTLW